MVTKKKFLTPEEVFGDKKYFDYHFVNGKYYQLESRDGQPAFVEISTKEVEAHKKMADELVKELKSSLDKEKVLLEVFMSRYDKKHLEELYKTVFKSKKKYKAKTREDYCVDMKVGNHIIPIID